MSFEITTAFVKQFSANVFHLSQQQGSRLRMAVRSESQVGKSAFWDRIGASVAQLKPSRHSDTPQNDTPHSRRRVDLADFEWGDLIDDADKVRLLMDPTNEYAKSAAWALGRAMDDVVIAAFNGSAFGGEEGGTVVPLPDSQRLVATDGVTAAGVNLNVNTLRRIKEIIDGNDVDPSISRHIVVNASMLRSLLEETEVTSMDFNSVRALVSGELNTFMGFNFIRTERLLRPTGDIAFTLATGAIGGGDTLVAATGRAGFAWAQDGMMLATGQDIRGEIARRPDKSFSTQVFASMSIGSTRMEEEKVVEFNVKET